MGPDKQNCEVMGSNGRMPRHVNLDNAINEMGRIESRLNALISKVTEGDVPKLNGGASDTANPTPALIDVLNNGGDLIRDHINNSLALIGELEERLF